MKYDATVARVEHRTHVFQVEAENHYAAREAALEAAGDHDFKASPVQHATEEVVSVRPAAPQVDKWDDRAQHATEAVGDIEAVGEDTLESLLDGVIDHALAVNALPDDISAKAVTLLGLDLHVVERRSRRRDKTIGDWHVVAAFVDEHSAVVCADQYLRLGWARRFSPPGSATDTPT
jgi:hypothetical protein